MTARWLAQALASARPRAPLLAELAARAREGAGEILRGSPQRTVVRIPHAGDDWVLKVYHPRRRLEWLRRRADRAPALREQALARALHVRLPGLPEVVAEQASAGLGLAARRWIPGRDAAEILAGSAAGAAAERIGSGLAALHRAGWSDPDLHPKDLLVPAEPACCGLAAAAEGELARGLALLPLDLGHARWSPTGAPPLARRGDVLLLILALPPPIQVEILEPLLRGYAAAAGAEPGWRELRRVLRPDRAAEWLAGAAEARRAALWRQSARCLRDNRDFERAARGVRRRTAPAAVLALLESGRAGGEGEVLAAGRRSRVARLGPVIVKTYHRPCYLSWLRRRLGCGPARRGFRRLYALELHGLEGARPLCAVACAGAEHLGMTALPGRPPAASELPLLARWLARLHAAGLGLRDAKGRNFLLLPDGEPALVDPDGMRRRPAPARDLGRLLAEAPAGSGLERAALAAYAAAAPPGAAPSRRAQRRILARAARFRAVLERKAEARSAARA